MDPPAARRARFMKDYGLGEYDAQVLVADPAMADYYEEAAKTAQDAKVFDGFRVGIQHFGDECQDRSFIRHLLHALFLDDLCRFLPGRKHVFKYRLGLLPGNGAIRHQVHQLPQVFRKKSRGTANPKRTNELIREELAKR